MEQSRGYGEKEDLRGKPISAIGVGAGFCGAGWGSEWRGRARTGRGGALGGWAGGWEAEIGTLRGGALSGWAWGTVDRDRQGRVQSGGGGDQQGRGCGWLSRGDDL